jgi:hypothetical protein
MFNDRLSDLERRLALAERELATTLAQVRALQVQERPRTNRRRDGVIGLLGVSLLVFAVTRAIDIEAQSAGPQVLTVKAPFRVVDANGKVILSADGQSQRASLTVGALGSGSTTIGVGASGSGYVLVSNPSGTDGFALGQYRGSTMGAHLVAADGQTVAATLSLDGSGKGQMIVGDPKSGGATVGVGRSGAGGLIVRRGDGNNGIVLGQLDGRPMSLGVFGDNAKELVSLQTGQKGGSVKVMTSTGAAVAALLAGDTGGGVALTGPAGGKSAVSLSVDATGGKVRIFPQAGGSTQAELSSQQAGGGAVNVYNSAGEAVVWLEATGQGQGRLQIGRTGTIYVDAGVSASGLGVVAAGPQVGGPPAGLVTPNFLLGRRGGK